jgi:hypothetical protein
VIFPVGRIAEINEQLEALASRQSGGQQ